MQAQSTSRFVTAVCGILVSVLMVGVLPDTATAAPAPAAAADTTTAAADPDAVAAAFTAAQASGEPVAVPSLTTQYADVDALPAGDLSADVTAGPVRVLVDGQWQDLDFGLQTDGALVTPSVAGNSVSFGAGSKAPVLARVAIPSALVKQSAESFEDETVDASIGRSDSDSDPALALGWPGGAIPSPSVDGDVAAYPNVGDGVDVALEAGARGFDVSLQVPAAPFADQVIEFPLALAGGTVVKPTKTPTTDEIAVLSDAGDQIGVIGPFTLTDSRIDPATNSPMLSDLVPVSIAKRDGTTFLQVPVDVLADPQVQYPLRLSASFGFGLDGWGRAWKGTNPADNDIRVGVLNAATRARGYVRFPVNQVGVGTVTSAKLSVWKDWTGSCSNKLVVVPMKESFKKFPKNNGWTGPSIGSPIGKEDVPCPQTAVKRINFDLPASTVQPWVSGTNNGLGLTSRDDAGSDYKVEWFRLCSPENCTGGSKKDNAPVLSVTYAPSSATTPTALDLTPRAGMLTNRDQPDLYAAFNATAAPHTQPFPMTGLFRVNQVGGGQVCEIYAPIPSAAQVRVPMSTCPGGTKLANGASYTFTAQGITNGGAAGPVSAPFGPFTVDTTPPPPVHVSATGIDTVTGASIPVTAGQWVTAADPSKPVSYTIVNDPTVTDLVAYQVVQDANALADVAATPGKPVTIPWVAGPGWHQITVSPVDHAGNVGTQTTFEFGVGPPTLTAPGIQQRSAKYFPVAAVAPAPESGQTASAQVWWKAPGDTDFTQVTTGLSVGTEGNPWDGSVTIDKDAMTLPASLRWDITDVAGAHSPPVVAPSAVQVKAVFTVAGASPVETAPVTVQWIQHAFGGNFAVDDVGPGSVALSTGELSVGATDAVLPGPGGVSAGRSWLSYEGTPEMSVFGPGWVPSVPLPESGAGDATIVIGPGNASITLTYPDGWVDTYGPGTPPAGGARAGTSKKNKAKKKQAAGVGAGQTFVGTGDTAQDGGYLTLTDSQLTFTQPSGDVTTWTNTDQGWNITAVSSSTVGDSTRTFYTDATDTTDGTIATVTGRYSTGTSAASCATLTEVEAARAKPGCRILWWTVSKKVDPAGDGAYPGQVSAAWIRLWDGSGANATDTRVADYTYSAQGLLEAVWDPRISPNLVTRYSYDAQNSDDSSAGPWMLTKLTPASANDALIPLTMSYDLLGRLTQVSQAQPTGGPAANTFIVYGVGVGGDGTNLPNLTPDAVVEWDQPRTGAPIGGVAVFDPDPANPGLSPPTETDLANPNWVLASMTYLNGQGAPVNTAAVGSGQWLIDTLEYDYTASSGGQVVSTLSGANRALALGSLENCQAADVAPVVCNQALPASRAVGLSTYTVYDPARPGVVTDTYGPIVSVANPAALPAASTPKKGKKKAKKAAAPLAGGPVIPVVALRTHTHTDYNAGAPADVVSSGAALPTTTTTGGWTPAGSITPPRTPSSSAGDVDVRTSVIGYGTGVPVAGAVAGWGQRAATTSTIKATSSGDITTSSAISDTGTQLATKQPMSSGSDAGTTLSWPYTAGPAMSGAPAGCGNKPGWDGLACYSRPAAQPSGPPMPDALVASYSPLLAATETVAASGSSTRSTSITYDNAGRPVTTTPAGTGPDAGAPVGASTVAYDPGTGQVASTSQGGKTVRASFDRWGQTVAYTDAGENTTSTAYNIAGQATMQSSVGETSTFTYDTARDGSSLGEHRGLVTGQNDSVSDFGSWTVSYAPSGGPTQVVAANGVRTTQTYGPAGELLTRNYSDHAGAALFAGWTQEYNIHGQIVAETGPAKNGSQADTYTSVFGFDTAARLVTDSFTPTSGTGATTRAYTLNADSNRTTLTTTSPRDTSTVATTFDTADRARSVTRTGTGAGTGAHEYDSYGETLTLPAVDGGDEAGTFTWTVTGRTATQSTTGSAVATSARQTLDLTPARPQPPETPTTDPTDTGGQGQQKLDEFVAGLGAASTDAVVVTDDPTARRSVFTRTFKENTETDPETGVLGIDYVYSDSSDSPERMNMTVTIDGASVGTMDQVFTAAPTGGLGITTSTTVAEEDDATDGIDVDAPDWWRNQTTTREATLNLSNPHGDVAASIPNTSNIAADQAYGITTYSPFGEATGGLGGDAVYGWEGTNQRDELNTNDLITMGARSYNPATGRFLTVDPIPGGNANPYIYPTDPCNRQDLSGLSDRRGERCSSYGTSPWMKVRTVSKGRKGRWIYRSAETRVAQGLILASTGGGYGAAKLLMRAARKALRNKYGQSALNSILATPQLDKISDRYRTDLVEERRCSGGYYWYRNWTRVYRQRKEVFSAFGLGKAKHKTKWSLDNRSDVQGPY